MVPAAVTFNGNDANSLSIPFGSHLRPQQHLWSDDLIEAGSVQGSIQTILNDRSWNNVVSQPLTNLRADNLALFNQIYTTFNGVSDSSI